jgi:phospholipase/carboxylesterase
VSDSIIIQQPLHAAQQLLVLHHGVGGNAQDMVPLGQHLAAQFPNAFIVSVHAPYVSDLGSSGAGAQWFSVQGITDENRPTRVAEVMPAFIHNLRYWQKTSGVEPGATAVIGFSQGAIMALEAAQAQAGLAARIVALSGRYAQLPEHAPEKTTLHFIHGKSDPVIQYGHCVTAAERLVRLGGDITADVIPYLVHEVTEEVMDMVVERFTGHIPKHQWEEVQKAAAEQQNLKP